MFRKKRTSTSQNQPMNTTKKIVVIMIVSIASILIIGSISGYLYIKSALKPVNIKSKEEIAVSIPIGSSSSDIGNILEKKGIIKDGRVFRFYTKFKNESDFKAGEYLLSPAMEFDTIISSLKRGYSDLGAVHKITIPEGKTIDEIADIYAKEMGFPKADFLEKANDPTYIKELMKKHPDLLTDDIFNKEIRTPLEGYLFAATYEFNEQSPKIETIIERMLEITEKVVLPYQKQIEERGLTIHEAVTMASLVEKETGAIDQREEIAGVFYNRLEEGMRLQTDPTVLYALGKHKQKVLLNDLKVKSPYNTYVIEGLPVGPISNFGTAALKAAMNPKETKNLYFLHDSEGKIYFSETHDQHIQYKREHIK